MRSFAMILAALSCYCLQAQVSFRTVVPQQPVVAGEAFQVQYILEGGEKGVVIQPPAFTGCRVTSGPNMYSGTIPTGKGIKTVRNFVYTIEAVKPGKLYLPGTTIIINNKAIRSDPAVVEVVSQQEAARLLNKKGELLSSDYFLRPGEDPYKKIRENLFIKVLVDKQKCLVGEPVLAIFKLYSRLESRSDIIRNPGFYGFTVYDMVNLTDKQVAAETVNGRLFDVHTIRKVQLYPLQPGRFTIDPMEVKNRVEFSRSAVNKKTEQEIAEGMMGVDMDEPAAEGTDVFETTFSTAPVEVEVKPLPEKAKPAAFTGAVGRFTIKAGTPDALLAKNEQGFLEITISGKGNFTQVDAPVMQWPAGVEGFEPVLKDELDKTRIPLQGHRTFRYPFVCAAPGHYSLPAVSFSYFDPDSNSYKTIKANSITVEMGNEVKKETVVENPNGFSAEQNEKAAWTAGLIAVAALLLILLYWIFGKKDKKLTTTVQVEKPAQPSAEELLQPVYELVAGNDREFYTALQSAIWSFAGQRFGLSGSTMSKQGLAAIMNERMPGQPIPRQLVEILETCEAGIFTGAVLSEGKENLLLQTKELMDRSDALLNQGKGSLL